MTRLLLLLAASAALAGSWKAMMSPGPVHADHADVAGDCDACHVPFAGIPDARCLDCHTALRDRIAAGDGWHAQQEKDCIGCHVDHRGEAGETLKELGAAAFTHDQTGFDLHGAHVDVDCATCHTGPLGELAATCASCHDDAHGGSLGAACDACHEPKDWGAGLKTKDAHSLSMDGAHGEQACADCHPMGANLDMTAACADCHEEAHGGTTSPCDQCHQPHGWTPAEFDHGPCTCAFPGKHQTVACLACHDDFVFTGSPTRCAGCHTKDRPHQDLGECARCHTATSWSEGRFDHNRQSAFAITGEHTAVSCAQCHTTEGEFRGAPSTCEGCHADAGADAHGDFGPCAECHTPDGFTPSTFDHASTGFALTGSHGDVRCQDCHAEKTKDYPR